MLTLWAQGQILVDNSDYPILARKDTLIFKDEAWIESVDSEMQQRSIIVKLEKKIAQTLDILHKKKGYELQIDSLIIEAERVRKEKDSILKRIDTDKLVITKKIERRINYLVKEIDNIKEQYFIMRKSRNNWRKTSIFSLLGNVIFLFVLL